MANGKIIAKLGTFTVTDTFVETKTQEYARAYDNIEIGPQTADLVLVDGQWGRYICITLQGKVISSWQQSNVGKQMEYHITDTSTWAMAHRVNDGYHRYDDPTDGTKWPKVKVKVGTLTLEPGYKVAQHLDRDTNEPAFYNDGRPMLRIVKEDGSPIEIKMAYWSHEAGSMFKEPFL